MNGIAFRADTGGLHSAKIDNSRLEFFVEP